MIQVDTITTLFQIERSFRLDLVSAMVISYDDVMFVSSIYERITFLDRHNFDEIADTFIHAQQMVQS